MTTFTVVIPTFNNCKTLRYSIASVLSQSFPDFELLVVGDGCPEGSKELVRDFSSRDPRVVFFDNPKGPRHGELHRHAALQKARGRYITYLSDDDLFLPQHLSAVLRAFEQGYDFVHTLPVHVLPSGTAPMVCSVGPPELPEKLVFLYRGLIDRPESVTSILEGRNFLSLSAVSHTRDLYDRLPHGWRTTPQGMYTDLYMWQQFASLPAWKGVGIPRATVIHCAKSLRNNWSEDERAAEISEWSLLIEREEVGVILERAALSIALSTLVAEEVRISSLEQELESARENARRGQERVATLEGALTFKEAELSQAEATLQKIYQSRAMRAVERLRRYSLVKRVGGAIASFLSR